MLRHTMPTTLSALCLCVVVNQTSAVSFTWEGSTNRYWGNFASWTPNTAVPDDNTDTITFNNDFISFANRQPILADSLGNDATYIVKSISHTANTAGNRAYTFSNVTSGTGLIVMDTDVSGGSALISLVTGYDSTNPVNNNTFTFNVGVQLRDPLTIHTAAVASSSGFVVDKAFFNREISEFGGSFAITKTGTQKAYLNAANSYSGGTIVGAGELIVGAAATLGSGDVAVNGGLLIINNLSGIIYDQADVAIANGAIINLAAGIEDVVGSLTLGGTPQIAAGTYGSLTSAADFKSAFFTGTGVLTIIPEPGTLALAGLGALMIASRRHRRNPVAPSCQCGA